MVRRIAAGPDGLVTGDDPAEIISTVAGGGTQWPPQNGDPRAAVIDGRDLAFNQQGDLYVGGTAVIVRITPAPGSSLIDGSPGEQLTTVAGHPILTYAPYQGDGGLALDANLNGLFGIEILPNGDLVIADTSASRIRRVFAGSDACVAPVLSLAEVEHHAHNAARGTFVRRDEVLQPGPAPRFSRTKGEIGAPPRPLGADTDAVLRDWGFAEAEIGELKAAGIVGPQREA